MANQLIFDFMGTRYAVPLELVRATHWLPALAAAPDLPPYFAGLMNLHGEIVPVIDLARRFGRAAGPCNPDQSVIVLRDETHTVALLADDVREVADIPGDIVEPYFQVEGASLAYSPSVICGCVQWEGGVVILLDAAELLRLMFDVTREALQDGDPALVFHAASPEQMTRFLARSEQLASPPVVPDEKPDWYALVRIDDSRFAIALSRVSEFAHLGNFTPVPCCPDHVLGCINLRGSIIAVLDVAPILLGASSRMHREVVILDLGGQRVALAVCEVIDVCAFPASATTELNGQAFGHPHARHLLQTGDTVAEILDLDSLFREGLLEVKEQV